jgi:hypothetical protein
MIKKHLTQTQRTKKMKKIKFHKERKMQMEKLNVKKESTTNSTVGHKQ